MTVLDIIIITVVVIFGVLGYRDGVFRRVCSILGFWGGLIIATLLMTPIGSLFIQWLGFSKEAAYVVAFYFVFMTISGIEFVLYKKFFAPPDTINLGSRIIGIVFGIFQGTLVISLILVLLAVVNFPKTEIRKESIFYYSFFQAAPAIYDHTASWLPGTKTFLEEIHSRIERLKRQ